MRLMNRLQDAFFKDDLWSKEKLLIPYKLDFMYNNI